MAWWQKKVLRYALSRTGLLDDKAIDLDNLDIALGKKNVVELKDVGLNIKRISKLAQLPPSLRIEAAKVLSLKLTVPADIYQSPIVAEVDGVEVSLRLEEPADDGLKDRKRRTRSPVSTRTAQHRKVHRRIHSPPPYDPGGPSDDEEARIPTTQELVRSMLQEEPAQERRQLEASVAATAPKGLEESMASESSDGDDLGTGAAIGLPAFLTSFLQGIVDRLQVTIKNVEARLETEVPCDGGLTVPLTLRLRVGNAELASADAGDPQRPGQREVRLQEISVDLLSDADIFAELLELPSRTSPAQSDEGSQNLRKQQASDDGTLGPDRPPTSSSQQSFGLAGSTKAQSSPKSADAMRASALTADSDRFADAAGETESTLQHSHTELDIQPGDDNISWGSRRNKSSAPMEDLWNSMASEDDLPDSLLLDRASTPRGHASRGSGSPQAKREPSPYSRHLQSPGSWPRLEESPRRHRLQQSPGSWPTMDQSQASMYQPMTPGPGARFDDGSTDNKRAALESASVYAPPSENFPDSESDMPLPSPNEENLDDLATSRVFSHEEAESMYMSAMAPASRTSSPNRHVPGGWSSNHSERSSSPEETRRPLPMPMQASRKHSQYIDDDGKHDDGGDLAYGDRPYSTPKAPDSGEGTPRAVSPELERDLASAAKRAERHLVHVDVVTVWLPPPKADTDVEQQQPNIGQGPSTRNTGSNALHGMPGTFSAYSEMVASRRRPENSMGSESSIWLNEPFEVTSGGKATEVSLGIEIGTVRCQVDIPCVRLLYRLASMAAPALASRDQRVDPSLPPKHGSGTTNFTLSTKQIWVGLKESLGSAPIAASSPGDNLLSLNTQTIDFKSSSSSSAELRIDWLRAYIGSSPLLAFNRDRGRNMTTSVMINEDTPEIALSLTLRKDSPVRRQAREITIETLPLELVLDLDAVDQAFSSFGGLSGVLEVGSSIMAESGSVSGSPIKSSKGVRFEGEPARPMGPEPELKLNGRIGGVNAVLQSSQCSVQLQTTTVKAVYREAGAVATIEQVLLTGPYILDGRNSEAPLSAELSTLRLEYLLSPQDKDLERLLSLLTPSKDKYDSDDDILLDTLIRQRRKGAVARVSVNEAKIKCLNWDALSPLTSFGDELNKLSAVAKYLPEDERPGLLTLVRLKECEARLPVNERFGSLHVGLSDLHLAHVGLPALLALSIGGLDASQGGQTTLLHALVPLQGSDNLPVVMARMLGNEVEPTVKIKIFNACIEYSVPPLLALTSMDTGTDTTEQIVQGMVQSVADFTLARENSGRSDSSGKETKRTKIDLLVHDSAIGLTPQKLNSKALLVLTDARFQTAVPPEETVTANIELRRAAIFVADQVFPDKTDAPTPTRGSIGNTTTKPALALALMRRGFMSVGSIMSAKISASVKESSDGTDKSVDIDVKNELLLLETCADSTQTLIATLNGLAPPIPPSKQPKYLTEPMTIEDMMASFTGEAVAKPGRPAETLFDVEEEPNDDLDSMLDMPAFIGDEDDDGLLAESEMTSSLYGPVSGILGGVDKPDDDEDEAEEFPETVESLLEDDPFEMPDTPDDAKLGDAMLLRELSKQAKPTVSEEAVDLGLYEVEDLGFDALGSGQTALGTQYRFNTPATRMMDHGGRSRQQDLPFRLRLRDLHIIWNIYDGYDWQRTRHGISEAVEQVETRIEQRKAPRRQGMNDTDEEESVIGDFLFNSIYIGVANNQDAQDLRRQINRGIDDLASETESVPMSGQSRPTTAYSASGRPIRQKQRRRLKLERSKAHKVAFELKGVSADVVVFPPDSKDVVSSVDVRVRNFEIFDNVPTSTWRKFLTHLENDPSKREMSKPMMHIELLNVRTLENFAASEIVLRVQVLPLRLHVDQDALDFITRFFEFKDETTVSASSGGEQPFLQRVEVETVDLCLDYKPKKVDYAGLRSGHTTEFMNFVILDAANIRLKHAIVYGIKGFEPLHKTLNDVWMPDVKRNQLPTVLAGLAPVRSLVNIGSGMRDVVAIPIREYKKDGRIVRSIQKGAFHFAQTTTSELARLGAKVAIGTQNLLQGAEDLLSPVSTSPSGRPSSVRRRSSDQPGWHDIDDEADDEQEQRRAISAYANQPLGVLSGLRSARRYLEHDLLTARDALIAVQGEVLESATPGGAAAAVVKHAPTVILRPMIGTTRAVGTALLGVGNRIDPGGLRRVDDKYKRR